MERRIRLYCEKLNEGVVTIAGAEVHHARNVLRLSVGDTVELFDGFGRSASATVQQLKRDTLIAQAGALAAEMEDRLSIVLATAIPKSNRQQCVISHGTELGVNAFWPVCFEHSAVTKAGVEKWRRWTIEACKQSGRNRLPEILPAMSLPDALAASEKFEEKFFGDAAGECRAMEFGEDSSRAVIFIGPEGGFSDTERELLIDAGARAMCVGRYVLRIETAGTAIVSALRAAMG